MENERVSIGYFIAALGVIILIFCVLFNPPNIATDL